MQLQAKMTTPEIGSYYDAMTQDMGRKLSGYYLGLQYRYGDPRVYAAQQQEMQRQEAAVVHSKARHTAELLKEAYGKQVETNRSKHSERMAKHRSQSAASHPESAAPKPRRKPAPAPPRSSAAATAAPSRS